VDLAERVSAVTGREVVAFVEIPGAGGYTPALRRIAQLADGETVFVKAAVDVATTQWLQSERAAYEALGARAFLPAYVGSGDGVLVLEDLRHGKWPPPWMPGDVERVFALLHELGGTPAPAGIPALSGARDELVGCWEAVLDAPQAFLALGLCSSEWLDAAAPALVEAASSVELDGSSIVHYDVRSDNLCLLADRTVLVDWNGTCQGNAEIDLVLFAQTVTTEGGPAPWELLPDADPALVATAAGYFADRAPKPLIPAAPRVREVQLSQLRVCLGWVARVLGLQPPPA
jgi:hypothetical protein